MKLALMICATPRVGATALLETLRTVPALAGCREWPDAPTDGDVWASMVHWAQMPVEPPAADHTRYVYLWRADLTAQAVSWAVAAATGRYHSHQPDPGVVPAFDATAVAEGAAALVLQDAAWRAWLADRRPLLELEFGTDVAPDVVAAARRVLAFAGVAGDPSAPAARPIDTDAKRAWLDAARS